MSKSSSSKILPKQRTNQLGGTNEEQDLAVVVGGVYVCDGRRICSGHRCGYARQSDGFGRCREANVDEVQLNAETASVIRLQLGQSSGLAYYFVGGGLPIVVQDQLIGAIGVGGGNMDEMCAYTALTKVLGPQPPLPTSQPPAGAAPAPGPGQ